MGKDESRRETTATAVVGDLPDATLLERVATQRDEDAFAALAWIPTGR
jgi:hypothetical protein